MTSVLNYARLNTAAVKYTCTNFRYYRTRDGAAGTFLDDRSLPFGRILSFAAFLLFLKLFPHYFQTVVCLLSELQF